MEKKRKNSVRILSSILDWAVMRNYRRFVILPIIALLVWFGYRSGARLELPPEEARFSYKSSADRQWCFFRNTYWVVKEGDALMRPLPCSHTREVYYSKSLSSRYRAQQLSGELTFEDQSGFFDMVFTDGDYGIVLRFTANSVVLLSRISAEQRELLVPLESVVRAGRKFSVEFLEHELLVKVKEGNDHSIRFENAPRAELAVVTNLGEDEIVRFLIDGEMEGV